MYFFIHEKDLPDGVGFGLFSITHLVWIVGIACICLIVCVIKRRQYEKRNVINIVTAFLALLFGVLEYGTTAIIGSFDRYTLPLHLCSLAYVLCPLHAICGLAGIHKVRLFLDQILYYPCLIGVALAILFPDWSRCPAWNYLTITGFMGHGLVLAYILSSLVNKELELNAKYVWMNIGFIIVYSVFIFAINNELGTNYFFMARPSLNSPLSMPFFKLGYAGYLLIYALLLFIGLIIFYFPLLVSAAESDK